MEIPFKNSPSRKSSIYDESLRFQVPSKKKKKIIKRKEFLSKKLLEKIFNSNNDPTNIS